MKNINKFLEAMLRIDAMRSIAVIALATVIGFVLIGCEQPGGSSTVRVTGVTLDETVFTLAVGATKTLTAIVEPASAANQNVSWSSSNAGVATVSNGAVTAIAIGTATITVTTADGGKTADCVVTVQTVDPTAIPITSAEISIAAPVKDMAPNTTATGTGNFSIGAVSWSPNDNPFKGGEVYTATVTLTANSKHAFAFNGFTATINGQSTTVSNNTGAAVTLSYIFPATDTRTVTGITVKTQPTKLVYTHGDTLDLAGLKITMLFELPSDLPEDIEFDDFADRNITADPAHGNHLIHVEHDGSPVTIQYGNLEADTNNLTVNPQGVTITGLSADDKVYDGTTTAAITGTAALNGRIGSDDVTVNAGTAAFADKNVGNGKTVTFSGYSLGGDDAGNYSLTQPASVTATISKKGVTITGLGAAGKTYDGNTTATATGTAALNGVIGNDVVTVVAGTAAFADKNVGNGKTVSFSGYSLGGTDADNYTLSSQPANATAAITKAVGALVDASTKNSVTMNSITVNPVSAPANGEQGVQYAISTASDGTGLSTWQDSATLGSLAANASYYVYARSAESDNYNAGTPSVSAAIKTAIDLAIVYSWDNEHDVVGVTIADVTLSRGSSATVTITADDNTAYSGQNWYVNGVQQTASDGDDEFIFSSVGRPNGKYIVGLTVAKGGKYYNTNITITVEN